MIVDMKTTDDAHVARMTVSLPADLFARGEKARVGDGISRSAFVAQLYRRYLDDLDEEERVARYRTAYAALPVTAEEQALTEASMDLLAAEDVS